MMDLNIELIMGKAPLKMVDFGNREEVWEKQVKLIKAYREERDEQAYSELLGMCIPLIRKSIKTSKLDDLEEYKLLCLEVFHNCVLDYDISDNPYDILFTGYLQTMLRFAFLDHLNFYVQKREDFTEFNESVHHVPEVIKDETVKDVNFYLALDKLTKRERQVMTMYYFEHKGESEIREELGIAESSFPVYLSKSKTAFRKAYLEVMESDLLQLSDEEMEHKRKDV